MNEITKYVTHSEFAEMMVRVTDSITTSADTINALRTVTLLIVSAIAEQKNIDAQQFMDDISSLIENHYPQDSAIPTVVLDFRAELARALSTKE